MIQWLHKTQLHKVKPVDSTLCRITKCKLNHDNYLVHGTNGLTFRSKDKSIKCLPQGYKGQDWPGRDSNPHVDNTRTWVRCTRPLGHDTLGVHLRWFAHICSIVVVTYMCTHHSRDRCYFETKNFVRTDEVPIIFFLIPSLLIFTTWYRPRAHIHVARQ